MPSIGNGDLRAARREMRAHQVAICQVLTTLPVSDSPTLGALYPAAPNLYVAICQHRETLPFDNPLRLAVDRIVEYIRLHSDAMGIQTFLGVSDEWMDDLFRAAMAIEAATI